MAKIKYRLSDGLILAWGHMPNLEAGVGEAVEDSTSEVGVVGKIRTGSNNYRDKTAAEIKADTDTDKVRKNALKAKLVAKGIDRQTLEALRELNPEDL